MVRRHHTYLRIDLVVKIPSIVETMVTLKPLLKTMTASRAP